MNHQLVILLIRQVKVRLRLSTWGPAILLRGFRGAPAWQCEGWCQGSRVPHTWLSSPGLRMEEIQRAFFKRSRLSQTQKVGQDSGKRRLERWKAQRQPVLRSSG